MLEYVDAGGTSAASLSWVATAPSSCPSTINGWRGEYFANATLSTPLSACQDDAAINFNWGGGGPSAVPSPDYFSTRWTRTQQFLGGTYTFSAGADDGVRLYLDGIPIIDSWVITPYAIRNVTRTIGSGPHSVVMEYYEWGGYAQATLTWSVSAVPGAPSNVSATPGDTTAVIAWAQGVTSGEPATTSYTVTATAVGQTTRTCTSTAPVRTCTLSGLVNGVAYSTTVTATNSVGTSPAGPAIDVIAVPAIVRTSNVQLWLDAADPATMFTDTAGTTPATSGQDVARWNDKSAAGNHLTQSNTARLPVLGSQGARTALVFDGTADTLTRATSTMPVGTADSTTFAVGQRIGTPAAHNTLVAWGTNTYSQFRFFGTPDTRRYMTANGTANPWGPDWPSGAPGLLVGQFSSAAGTIWVDGAPPITTAGSFSTVGSVLSVGANSNIQFWSGNIDEVIVVDRVLTGLERRIVEEYLARKWNFPITPSAPTASSVPGNNSATISWTNGWDGGSAVTSTTVVASPGGGTCTATAPATTCTITGLTNGTTYTFTVTPSNTVGVGVTAAAGPTTPGAPLAPANAVGLGGTNSILASWTPVPAAGGAAITSTTAVAAASGQTTRSCTATAPATTCLITGLTNDVTYSLAVTASNSLGAGPAAVTPATPATPVLDRMSATPVAAYGLRKLDSDYTGAAITVRRTSDNGTANIGFLATGQLDVASLLAFVGTGDGHVTIHYDQSGNGRHAVQAAAGMQPRIVIGGNLVTINGRPAVDANSNRGVLSGTTTPFTMGQVVTVVQGNGATWGNYHDVASHDGPRNGTILEIGGDNVHYNLFPAALRKNGVSIATNSSLAPLTTGMLLDLDMQNATSARTRIGYGNYDVGGVGGTAIQAETLVFPTTISTADRIGLTRNVGNYYGIAVTTDTPPRRSLDRLTVAPAAAYGLRLLDGDHTGPALRVRRSSDNSELDVGFTFTGHLDTAALLAFVGSGSGYVTTWYDQSGNGRNLSQPTAAYQPRIVNAGVLDTKNGRPTIRQATKVDGMGLQTAWSFTGTAITASAVTSLDPAVGDVWKGLVSIGTAGQDDQDSAARGVLLLQNLGTSQIGSFRNNVLGPTATITSGTQLIATSTYDGTNASVRTNGIDAGTVASTGTFSTSLLAVGTRLKIAPITGPEEWVGTYSEVVVFPTALGASDRSSLETEQSLFYGVQLGADAMSTPVLDQVSTTAPVAAYGLRLLRTGYTGPAIQVRRSSDNTTQDIGFTASGQLDLVALTTFVGTGDGFVSIHYDQSGNGRNAVQTNTWMQPRIVVDGIPVALGNRIGIDATLNRTLLSNAGTSFTMGEGVAVALSPTSTFGYYHDLWAHDGARNGSFLNWGATNFYQAPVSLFRNGVSIATNASLSPITSTMLLDAEFSGQDVARTRVGYGNLDAGTSGGAMVQSETLVFAASLTDPERAAIARNEGAYFGVTVAATTTPRTLDRMSAAPAAAYGLRQLDGDYTGPAVRVRRSSDSATQDIGFTPGGHLDTAALLRFVGTGDGFVTTWYDQSGNARNLTQATAAYQPRIVNAGVVETKNGRPAIKQVAGTDGTGLTASWTFTGTAVTTGAVASLDAIGGDQWKGLVSISDASSGDYTGTQRAVLLQQSVATADLTTFRGGTGPAITTTIGSQFIAASAYDGTTASIRLNGVAGPSSASSGAFSTTQVAVGRRFAVGAATDLSEWVGTYSEIVLFPSALGSTDRTTLETEQSLYFGIQLGTDTMSTPVLDQVSARSVAAYGLRKLRAAYTGPAIQVRRSSDNTTADIGFTASGQLDIQALNAFVGNGDGFITVHYDQSGNGRNAVQTTFAMQPRIVRNGYPVNIGNRIGIDTSLNRGLLSGVTTGFTIGETMAVLLSPTATWQNYHAISTADGDRNGSFFNSGATNFYQAPVTLRKNGVEIATGASLSPITTPFQVDAEHSSQTVTRTRIGYGNIDLGNGGASAVQPESIVFATVVSDDERAIVNANQTTYYGIPYTAPAATPRTLDRIATAPAAAYGLRLLDTDYAGPAIRVRRSSDNATTDIGFLTPSGRLNLVALTNFVGTGDGFVDTWYDQSGNGRNLTQPTAAYQPRIVSAGVVETRNGRPVIRQATKVDGMGLQATWNFTGSAATVAAVASLDDTTGDVYKGLVSIGVAGQQDFDAASRGVFLLQNVNSAQIGSFRANVLGPTGAITPGASFVALSTYDGANSTIRTNGVVSGSTVSTGTFSTSLLSVGTRLRSTTVAAPEEWVGTYSEIVVFPSALSTTDASLLEREQGLNNGVPIGVAAPVLDGLATQPIGAWGLRRLSSTYTGAAVNVRRSSDNATTDIGFTASGQLDLPALLAFAGGGDAFVTVEYDQSGNGRHLLQPTVAMQPRLVRNGEVVNINGRPALDATANRGMLSAAGPAYTMAEATSVLMSPTATWGGFHEVANHDGARNGSFMNAGGTTMYGGPYPLTLRKNGVDLAASASLAPITTAFVVDLGLTNPATTRTIVGFGNLDAGGGSSAAYQGDLVVMPTVLSPSNRTTLERDLGTWYGIPVA